MLINSRMTMTRLLFLYLLASGVIACSGTKDETERSTRRDEEGVHKHLERRNELVEELEPVFQLPENQLLVNEPEMIAPRIIHGELAETGGYPFYAGPLRSSGLICGSVLVAPDILGK
jgi:hypothetical protein